jgi:hypothetical protein
MDSLTPRRRAASARRRAVFAAPLLVGLIAAQRAAPHVRLVDFLLLFAGGALCGISLTRLVQAIRRPGERTDKPS